MASNASPFLDRLTKITSCWGNFPSALIMFLRSLIWTIWDLKSREPEKISFRSIEVGNLKFVGNFYFVFGWSWNILHFVLSKRTYTVLGLSFRAEKLNEEDETHVDNLFCSIFGILGDSLVIPHQKNCHLLKKKKKKPHQIVDFGTCSEGLKKTLSLFLTSDFYPWLLTAETAGNPTSWGLLLT